MKLKNIPYEGIISLRKNAECPYIYDVEIDRVEDIKRFDSFECHIVVYPYGRKITSQNISFNPFEEYVKDIVSHQRSAYVKMSQPLDRLFGLFLGLLIAAVFMIFKSADLFSVQSVVSIFGAYMVGKELWKDIERLLIDATGNSKWRYNENNYSFRLEKNTTLTRYSQFAKKCRYGKASLLPEKIDFIQQSNSQTVRMYFNMKDFERFSESSAHLLSVHLDKDLQQEFEKEGCMFGVKLSFNRRKFFFTRSVELFQSLSRGERGCLDPEGQWQERALFYRETVSAGRWKKYKKEGLVYGSSVITA